MSIKTLTTDQQIELGMLIAKVANFQSFDNETNHQLNYWAIELKPKRVRKKSESTTNVVDNPVAV